MWWRCTLTDALRPLLALALLILVAAGAVRAQGLESALMPGDVSRAHQKQEPDCKLCHVRFDKAAQPKLCLDCHKPVAADVRDRTGYHGRADTRECRSCHTEHKGREARIVRLDERGFDHAKTDFALKGRHTEVRCASCHKAGARHREAPSACVECHRKDDKHRDTLGARCESCHTEANWKETRFDHARTRFSLQGRHQKIKCNECHADAQHLASTPRECVACHRKDDRHKGSLGNRCESCHADNGWKEVRFDHAKSRFPLLQRHGKVRCQECHSDAQHFSNTPTACISCHRKEDAHRGKLGEKCESCHSEAGWKQAARFDHDRGTRFALRDAHRKPRCEACHRDAAGAGTAGAPTAAVSAAPRFADKLSTACISCHERDDRERGHKGRYGENCQTCHTEKAFKPAHFEHAREARMPLAGKHRPLACDACHKEPLYPNKLEQACVSCHQRDDAHKGDLGKDCAACHDERGWRETRFDHARTAFPLRERHARLECKSCHTSPGFKDARPLCGSCHDKDDAHKRKLGPQCDQCHDATDWKRGRFDHDQRSRFKLLFRHAEIRCIRCHTQPLKEPEKVKLPHECISCHKRDDIHFETKGTDCGNCHRPDHWRRVVHQDAIRRPH